MAQSSDIEDVLSSIRRLVAGGQARDRAVRARATGTNGGALLLKDGALPPPRPAPALILAADQRVTDPDDPFQTINSLAQEERDARDEAFITEDLPEEIAAITEDIPVVRRDSDADPEGGDGTEAAFRVPWPTEWESLAAELAARDVVIFKDAGGPRVPIGPAPITVQVDVPETGGASQPGQKVSEAAHHDPAADDEMTARAEHARPDSPNAVAAGIDPDADAPASASTDPPPDAANQLGDIDLRGVARTLPDDQDLRDLIAEIVREELAGELGERITRNVRKLVRREIKRAMASGELD